MSSRKLPDDGRGPGEPGRDFDGLERRVSQLREANEHLVVATLDAQALTDAAARANLRQEQFLATLAHELRNPLAPIRNAVEILQRQRPGETLRIWRWSR